MRFHWSAGFSRFHLIRYAPVQLRKGFFHIEFSGECFSLYWYVQFCSTWWYGTTIRENSRFFDIFPTFYAIVPPRCCVIGQVFCPKSKKMARATICYNMGMAKNSQRYWSYEHESDLMNSQKTIWSVKISWDHKNLYELARQNQLYLNLTFGH